MHYKTDWSVMKLKHLKMVPQTEVYAMAMMHLKIEPSSCSLKGNSCAVHVHDILCKELVQTPISDFNSLCKRKLHHENIVYG